MTINGRPVSGMTFNGVPYYDYLVSWRGAGFILYPIAGVHEDDDIKEAKHYLRERYDVIHIAVEKQRTKARK